MGRPVLRPSHPPQKHGREVGRIYSLFAWNRTARGRRKRRRYLDTMEELIELNAAMTKALGNYTPSIDRIDYREPRDPDVLVTAVDWSKRRGGRTHYTVKTKRLEW